MPSHSPPDVEVLHRQSARRASVTGARVLMGLSAVAGLAATAMSIQVVREAGPETLVVEIWRLAGFILFSGLFALLAYRPLHYAGVWELVIVNKLTLTIATLTFASDADGAGIVALVDGILTGVLLAAYVLSRAWRGWFYVTSCWPRGACRSDQSAPSPPEPRRRDARGVDRSIWRHLPNEREDPVAQTKKDRAGSALMWRSTEASLVCSQNDPITSCAPWRSH